MDLDDDYVPGSGESSTSPEGSPHQELPQGQRQEFHLPIRPGTSGSENQQGKAGKVASIAVAVDKSPLKRRRSDYSIPGADPSGLPLKRQKSYFTQSYAEIFNDDVKDAADELCPQLAPESKFETSRIGAVEWTPLEKERFFCALNRVGRHDIAAIARKIGTKSELETHQYLLLVQAASNARREDVEKRHRVVSLIDIPAAVEISQGVCLDLEKTADDIALRDERHDEVIEAGRWREGWLITPALASFLDRQVRTGQHLQYQHQQATNPTRDSVTRSAFPGGAQQKSFAEFLHVRNWLKLSERVFMNSAVPDGNWQFYSEEPPSMRATAFQDFRAVAESVIRRLVFAIEHAASARIAAKRVADPRTRNIIKVQDVHAAVRATLGSQGARGVGETNARKFWARAPRRLRLNVLRMDDDDSDDDDGHDHGDGYYGNLDDVVSSHTLTQALTKTRESGDASGVADDQAQDISEDEVNVMSFNEVEEALGLKDTEHSESSDGDEDESEPEILSDDASAGSVHEVQNIIAADANLPAPTSPHSPHKDVLEDDDDDLIDPDVDQEEVDRDLREALDCGDMPFAGTARNRQTIRRRIEKEHELEARIERADLSMSRDDELWLQEMLDLNVPAAAAAAAAKGGDGGDRITRGIKNQTRIQQRKEKEAKSIAAAAADIKSAGAGGGDGSSLVQQPQRNWVEELVYRAHWEEFLYQARRHRVKSRVEDWLKSSDI